MLQISPAPEKVLSDSELLNLYPWPNKPWIRANMVQSLDGGVTDQNQNTDSLSTDSDKQIFRLLRQLSEVILVGSKTAQSAPYLDIKINEQTSDFILIDTTVLNELKKIKDNDIFLRGIIPWYGFSVDNIEFKREKRKLFI